MKRMFSVIIAGLMLSAGASCQQEEKTPLPVLPEDGNCVVIAGKQKYDLNIRFLGKDVEKITVCSPENVKGISFCREKGKYTIAYNGLLCRRSDDPLPGVSLPSMTARAVRCLRDSPEKLRPEKTDSGYTFTAAAFSLRTDNNGTVSEMLLNCN